MVAPLHFHAVNISDPMAGNYDDVRSLAARMGLDIPRTAPLDFPAGSMFWARTATLRPLLDTGIQLSEFPEEAGQVDGTLAHAVERLYFVSCEAAGLHWVKVVQRSQFPEAAYGLDIADMHELSRALIAYRRDRQMLPFG
jgi:lipopolysaccharide biosynthesis protein